MAEGASNGPRQAQAAARGDAAQGGNLPGDWAGAPSEIKGPLAPLLQRPARRPAQFPQWWQPTSTPGPSGRRGAGSELLVIAVFRCLRLFGVGDGWSAAGEEVLLSWLIKDLDFSYRKKWRQCQNLLLH